MIDRIIIALAPALEEQRRDCQVERKKGIATPWNSMNEGEEVGVL